jgi:hypothetical protein
MLYFITETYLKVNTPITANVDVTDVTPYIATQAALRVQPILGTTFYNYFLTQYNNTALNPDEINLVEFIQPVIAWRSAEDAVFGLTYQLKNKGLQTQNGDYSASVSRNEVAFGMEHYAQKASFFEQRLIRWLLVNRALFPQFIDITNQDTDLRPMFNNYNCTLTINIKTAQECVATLEKMDITILYLFSNETTIIYLTILYTK